MGGVIRSVSICYDLDVFGPNPKNCSFYVR